MKDNFVMKLWCREMGIANCGGRVRDIGMFLLSFGLLSIERERERDEPNAAGRERRCPETEPRTG